MTGLILLMAAIGIPLAVSLLLRLEERLDQRRSPRFCTRAGGHDGPCNGFPRSVCARKGGLRK